jgi:hypothetical protein
MVLVDLHLIILIYTLLFLLHVSILSPHIYERLPEHQRTHLPTEGILTVAQVRVTETFFKDILIMPPEKPPQGQQCEHVLV